MVNSAGPVALVALKERSSVAIAVDHYELISGRYLPLESEFNHDY